MRVEDGLSTNEVEKLKKFIHLLDKWRSITDLISDSGFCDVWERHIADSVCLQRHVPNASRWLDIGSGAGFPGIVIGILLAQRPSAQIHCVERDGRKCAFLRTIVRTLNLPVKVHGARAEDLLVSDIGDVDVVTARAFSSIPNILSFSEPYLEKGAVAVLPRGRSFIGQVEGLDQDRYIVTTSANRSSPDGVFLHVQQRVRSL